MTWKTPIVKRAAQYVASNSGRLKHVLQEESALEYIANEPVALLEILKRSEVLSDLLASAENRKQLGLDEAALGWFEPDRFLETLDSSKVLDRLVDRIDADELPVEELLSRIGVDRLLEFLGPERMLEHLGAERMLEHLGAERMLERLGPERMLEHLGAERMLEHLGPERMLEHLGPERMLEHLGPERMLGRLDSAWVVEHLGRPDLLLKQLGPNRMLEHLAPEKMMEFLGPERMMKHLGPERMMGQIGPERMVKHFGPERLIDLLGRERVLNLLKPDWVAEHLGRPDLMLKQISPRRMLEFLDPEEMMNYLGPERMLKHLNPSWAIKTLNRPDLLVENLSPKRVLEHVSIDEFVRHHGREVVLDHLGPEAAVGHWGPQRLMDRIGAGRILQTLDAKRVVDHLGQDRILDFLDPEDPRLREGILKNDRALYLILSDERALRKVLLDPALKQRLRFLHAEKIASGFPYPLPAAVVSFLRSGSNFLQSVLTHSSGLSNRSIYGEFREETKVLLTVKSHALSPEYLFGEFERLVGDPPRPARIVLIQRDPRDVMISFYEYTQFNRKTVIRQEDFLDDICFFYASTIDPGSKRTVDKSPTSVLQAYQKHVRRWFIERPDDLDCLVVTFEELSSDPERAFGTVFEYLDLDCSLASEFLEVKVSQYSQEKRARARAGGWKEDYAAYKTLVDAVNEELNEEIKILGYEV